ncbi:thioredoxin [Prolixibacteraceae bacterium Z1-6]|uniref:Thioredoxin n=1 Tax=Draconibacterium aestuarii TaxID=2998507 RepID=A0A9X3J6L7_9BACT|nr:thioredoxin [Prolixibacteraceae bacterium Z1-6]
MNKLLILAISIVLFAACNSTSNDKNKNQKVENATQVETSKVADVVESDGKVIHLTTETFKQNVFNYEVNEEWKYEGTVPCIVDFYADWCGPCKKVAPILDDLAKEYDGKIFIYKVDTEKQQELAAAFGIRSIPSILFVPVKGQPQMAQGALPKETFVKAIEEVLLGENKES